MDILTVRSASNDSEESRQLASSGDALHETPAVMRDRIRATIDDVDDRVVVETLQQIALLSVEARPAALRSFADERIVAPNTSTLSYAAWKATINRTRTALEQNEALSNKPNLMFALDIATWRTCPNYILDKGISFADDFFRRFPDIPDAYWPALMETTLDITSTVWDHSGKCFATNKTALPGVSSRVASALLSLCTKCFDRYYRDNFGITMEQLDLRLVPSKVLNATSVTADRDILNPGHHEDHPIVVDFRYRCITESRYTTFLEIGDAWKPMTRRRLSDGVMEPPFWADRTLALFRKIEGEAYAFVRSDNGAQSDPLTADGQDLLLSTYIDLTQAMKQPGNILACLEKAFDLPMGFQVVAVDRWAKLIEHETDKAHGAWLLKRVTAWREDVVLQCLQHGEQINAVRAYVAELRAATALLGSAEAARTALFTTDAVFNAMPTAAGGAMLAFLAESAEAGRPLIDDALRATWTQAFVTSVNARMRFSSPAFAEQLGYAAGLHFPALPDVANGTETRFMALCERMAIRIADRDETHRAVLRSVATRIPTTPIGRRQATRRYLEAAGLFTPDAFGFVIDQVRNRAAFTVPTSGSALA